MSSNEFIKYYFAEIDFYEDNIDEYNVDEVVDALQQEFPERILVCLINQGFFVAPTKCN